MVLLFDMLLTTTISGFLRGKEMIKVILPFFTMAILFLCSSVYALEVFEPGYTIEMYATYPQSRETRGLTFDDFGYLYATHDQAGSVWRIAPDGSASEFVTGLKYPIGIVWAGGTNFGNYLYVLDSETFRGDIIRVGQNGTKTDFVALSGDAPSPMSLDRTGNYGGSLYIGSTGDDCIYRVDTIGKESIFSSFPYSRNGGAPASIAFDTTGNYGGLMYVATAYGSENSDVSGLFAIDVEGTATRFTKDLAQAYCIAIAPNCAFSQYMYVIGKSEFDGANKLWRIDPEGNATVFASSCSEVIFGSDGSLYVSEFISGSDMVVISRIRSNSYYIDAVNGNDSNSGVNSKSAFATIQKGIDTAPEGYSVLVKSGTYTDTIDFKGKAITVQGLADSEGIPVLEVQNDFAVSLVGNEGPDSVLKNLVIKNSYIGIFLVSSSPTISNVTIVDNYYGIRAYSGANPDISNCIFWNNSYDDLSGCASRYCLTTEAGEGNIYANPDFVDPNKGDYHLKSERGRYWPEYDVWVLDKTTSPCIDAGDPLDEPANEPMPNGDFINMGAYGGTPYASMSEMPFPNPDFNKDGIIDESDLADLVDQWLAAAGWLQ
jgi:parallel beta-helix repeat protein